MTSLVLFGINHRTAPLSVREHCTFTREQIRCELQRISAIPHIDGCALLFTCNRTEYYFACGEQSGPLPYATLFPEAHIFGNGLGEHIYRKENSAALHHLFRVAAGLDSQVLGENEVLFQVKEACRLSQETNCMGKNLFKIFEQTFRVGRKVRRETAISLGNVSIASLAIKFLERERGLAGAKVMLIGVNKITAQIARYLLEHALHTAFVGNRTFEKAAELARTLGGEAFHLDHLEELMWDVDIIITATSAPHFIIRREKVLDVLNARSRPLYIIDLAVPRDVDPALQEHPLVHLHNLETIQPLVEHNAAAKQQEAQKAEAIVREEARRLAERFFQARGVSRV
jgi:glutamyl-tRNA reductase